MFIAFIIGFLFAQKVNITPTINANKIEKDHPVWVAYTIDIPAKKHIYGKFTGASGLPTDIKIELPENCKIEKIYWPTPDLISEDGQTLYVYKGSKTILVKILPLQDIQEMKFKTTLSYLLCGGNCEPRSETIEVDTGKTDVFTVEQFESWYKDIPKFEFKGDVKIFSKNKNIEIDLYPTNAFEDVDQIEFIAVDENTFQAVEGYSFQKTQQGYKLNISMNIEWPTEIPFTCIVKIHKADMTETFLLKQNVEIQKPWWKSIWMPMFFAFLGGIILNFMPCVLPVISIKIIHLMESKANLWRNVLLYTLGITNTFMFLASMLMLLRYLGHHIGWGFQLQSANVIYTLILVFLFIALNFFDLFQVNAVFFKSSKIKPISLTPYFNGILTAVVATPCTAPFMGTALTYALFQPIFIVAIIFITLAIGFASPILLLPFFPSLLPKPGNWMVKFRHIMGFFILATVVWFLNILGTITNIDTMTSISFVLIATAFFTWVATTTKKQTIKIVWVFLSIVSTYGGYFIIDNLKDPHMVYENYNEADFNDYLNKGENLLLFFTAKWCVTCQLNHKVLDSKTLTQKLKEKKVRLIMLDWTSQSDQITKLLNRFGKQSIPCTVLIDKNKSVKIFPELLTSSMLNAELEKL